MSRKVTITKSPKNNKYFKKYAFIIRTLENSIQYWFEEKDNNNLWNFNLSSIKNHEDNEKKYKNNNNYNNIKSILDKTYLHTYIHPNKQVLKCVVIALQTYIYIISVNP